MKRSLLGLFANHVSSIPISLIALREHLMSASAYSERLCANMMHQPTSVGSPNDFNNLFEVEMANDGRDR